MSRGAPAPALCPALFSESQAAGGGWPRGRTPASGCRRRLGRLRPEGGRPARQGQEPGGVPPRAWSFLLCLPTVAKKQSHLLRRPPVPRAPPPSRPPDSGPPRGPTSDTTALGVGLAQESGGGAASTRLATARWLVQDVGQARPPAPRGPRLLPPAAELLAPARPPRRPGQHPLLREGLAVCGSPPVLKGTIRGASRLRLTRRGAPWPSACGADPACGGRACLLPRGG